MSPTPNSAEPKTIFADRMLSLGLARVSEQAAIAAARLIGRGDEKAADQAAVDAMRRELHRRGPPVAGSSHDGAASARTSERRSASAFPMRRTSRSPLSSMSRRSPFSGCRRAR